MSREFALIFALVAAVVLVWWLFQFLAFWHCNAVLEEMERWVVTEGKAPIGNDLPVLLEALGDAMPVRDSEAARILRRARYATIVRAGMLVAVAREATVTQRGARLLERASRILEAAARRSGESHFEAQLAGGAVP